LPWSVGVVVISALKNNKTNYDTAEVNDLTVNDAVSSSARRCVTFGIYYEEIIRENITSV